MFVLWFQSFALEPSRFGFAEIPCTFLLKEMRTLLIRLVVCQRT